MLCLVLKKVYHCRIHDATRKSLIINVIGAFRVAETITLILLKRLIYNYLQVALHRPSIEGSDRATRLPQRGLTAQVLFFHWDSVPNPDAPRDLCVLYVFAAATGWSKSPLLPTSLHSRVQIRSFCTRHAVFERSRGQIRPFCPRRPSLILSRTAARAVARARSAQGLCNSPRAMPLFGAPHRPIAFRSHKSLRKRISGYVLT